MWQVAERSAIMSKITIVHKQHGLDDYLCDNAGCRSMALTAFWLFCAVGVIVWLCEFVTDYWRYVLCVTGGVVVCLTAWWVRRRTKFSKWRQWRPLLDNMDVTSLMDEKSVKVKFRPCDNMRGRLDVVIALHWLYENGDTYGGYIASKKSADIGEGLYSAEFSLNEIVDAVFKKVGGYDIKCKVFPVVATAVMAVDVKDAIRYAEVNHLVLRMDLWKKRSMMLNESLSVVS